MTVVQSLAAAIVAKYPEIVDPSRQLELRDEFVRAFQFGNNPDNAMTTEESAAWDAGHPEAV